MAKKHLRTLALLLAAFTLGSMLLIACSRPGTASTGSSSTSTSGNNSGTTSTATSTGGSGTSTSTSTPSSGNTGSCPSGDTVKTGTSTFEQTCITLSKGTMLKVVQDQQSFHIFDYGQWNGTTPQPQTPAGAPTMKNLTLSGQSVNIGPFATAGTYHIYCTVHPGMNLTVVVK